MSVLADACPTIYEDGRELRDYVSIQDVVRANLMPLDVAAMHGRSYNVGGDRRVSVSELAEMVAAAAGWQGGFDCLGIFRVGDTRHVVSDVSALKDHGWAVKVTQEGTVKEYLDWAGNHPDLENPLPTAQVKMLSLGVLRRVNA